MHSNTVRSHPYQNPVMNVLPAVEKCKQQQQQQQKKKKILKPKIKANKK